MDMARSTGCRHKALSPGGSAHSADKDDSWKYVELAVADRQHGAGGFMSKELTTLHGKSLTCYTGQ